MIHLLTEEELERVRGRHSRRKREEEAGIWGSGRRKTDQVGEQESEMD